MKFSLFMRISTFVFLLAGNFLMGFPSFIVFKDKLPYWLRTARIATPYDYPENSRESWERGIDRAINDGANVILDWSCSSGDWKCLFDPWFSGDIEELRRRANYVHSHYPGVHYIIYVAPLEYVSYGVDQNQDGRVDPGKENGSLALQHPQWSQMGISGRRAIFYGTYPGMPFWVCSTCEDVWVSPANSQYRGLALKQAARLALSGIDGLWFDVPFLNSSYGEDWENQWPDVSPQARAIFKKQTGYSLSSPPISPHWNDKNWLKFVAWRYRLIREFVGEYYLKLKETNPGFALIIESSVGFNVSATQTASSPLDMPLVSDITAHEEGGTEGPVQYYSWLSFLSDILSWRHVDISFNQPSWLLSYVYAGYPDTQDLARLHAATVLLSGFNYYTSGSEGMSGIPSPEFRRRLFSWIASHEKTLYEPSLKPLAQVAVIFSQKTLDYRSRGNWELDNYSDGLYGMLMLLLESHIPFEFVSERELKPEKLKNYKALIFPSFDAMSDGEAKAIEKYVKGGGKIIATGDTSLYDRWGKRREDYALSEVFGISESQVNSDRVYTNKYGKGLVVFSPKAHEQYFYWEAAPWNPEGGRTDREGAEEERKTFISNVFSRARITPLFTTDAPETVSIIPWKEKNGVEFHFINYTGVDAENSVPLPRKISLRLNIPGRLYSERYLNFLGEWRQIHINGGRMEFKVGTGGILSVEGTFKKLMKRR